MKMVSEILVEETWSRDRYLTGVVYELSEEVLTEARAKTVRVANPVKLRLVSLLVLLGEVLEHQQSGDFVKRSRQEEIQNLVVLNQQRMIVMP